MHSCGMGDHPAWIKWKLLCYQTSLKNFTKLLESETYLHGNRYNKSRKQLHQNVYILVLFSWVVTFFGKWQLLKKNTFPKNWSVLKYTNLFSEHILTNCSLQNPIIHYRWLPQIKTIITGSYDLTLKFTRKQKVQFLKQYNLISLFVPLWVKLQAVIQAGIQVHYLSIIRQVVYHSVTLVSHRKYLQ